MLNKKRNREKSKETESFKNFYTGEELNQPKKTRTNFNAKINTKNVYYDNPPNFEILGDLFPNFKKFLRINSFGNLSIDWKDKDALRELTRCLLIKDFHLVYWDIPDGFLIPTITSRCNYINWIHDLVSDQGKSIRGVDIGTGANCIYPLLGHQLYGWEFVASDVNEEALKVAEKIVRENSLEDSIRLVKQENGSDIFQNIIKGIKDKFHFTMCNPPFFETGMNKKDNPNTVREYNEHEVYYPGGELGFITKMIEESITYKDNVIWFTTLVGLKSNLEKIYNILKECSHVQLVRQTVFYQGKLVRWGIAWTFQRHLRKKRRQRKIRLEIKEI